MAGSDGQVPVRPPGNHFDFIEVGTSDWGTMLQFFAGETGYRVASQLASEVRTSLNDIRQVRGLAVEAVKELLDALPDLPRVTKVAAAMDENGGGTTTLHFVPGKDIDANLCKHWAVYPGSDGHEVDVFWYAKSLASIGQPHPHLKAMLRDVNRLDLLASRQVPVLSWGLLCEQYNVTSVDVVQLDCEGKDAAIVRGLAKYCEKHPAAWPRVIQFEANQLTPELEVRHAVGLLKQNGYMVRFWSSCNILLER